MLEELDFLRLQGIVKVQGAGFSEKFVPTSQNDFTSQRPHTYY
jgi:hypothetical protein